MDDELDRLMSRIYALRKTAEKQLNTTKELIDEVVVLELRMLEYKKKMKK